MVLDSQRNDSEQIKAQWNLSRERLQRHQLERLNNLLTHVADHPFYQERHSEVRLPLTSLDQLAQIPLLTKQDLIPNTRGQPGKIFSEERGQYTRYHQTSGTSGHPMPVFDTKQDWGWWLNCWQHVLTAAEVTDQDTAMMAFSFGPFIGFWTACDAFIQAGAMVVPGGGMSSETRLQMIFEQDCTLVCCTPTYALHLLETAGRLGMDLASSPVTRLIVAGEPGGSVSEIRERISNGWGARVIDHVGASELGAWGFGDKAGSGIHVIETEFIAECLCFDDGWPQGRPAREGEPSELVLTGLGRFGGPAIRYRTGDMINPQLEHDQECRFLFLEGGVLGRADDMVVVRGVNIFPSSLEAIVRQLDATTEFRVFIDKQGEMDSLHVEAELSPDRCDALSRLFQSRLAMRIDVQSVTEGSLPRFQAKSKRWIDRRANSK